jgi:hypothetical protein
MRQCFVDANNLSHLSFVCANVFEYFTGAYIFVYFVSAYIFECANRFRPLVSP